MMHVVKLDGRYSGHHYFSHRVEFYGPPADRIRQWIGARNWLWKQFGPSAEQSLARAHHFAGEQPKWAWDADKSAIYLADEAYTMFQLKKEFWEIK